MTNKSDYAETAHKVFRKSIGESEPADAQPKNAAAVEMGSKGGKARAANMSADQRKEVAKKAAAARWGK
ncbi:MAG: RNA-binding protein [bacterium]|nr:RNA-binding protein [bacterium]